MEIKGKKGKPSTFVTEDEEYKKVNYDKFTSLPTGQCTYQSCGSGSVGSISFKASRIRHYSICTDPDPSTLISPVICILFVFLSFKK